jgi:hypothetical protein
MFDCTCDGAPAGGTTGGSENPWADYDEAELLAACEELLAMTTCGGDSTTGGGGSDEVGDTGPATITDSSPTTDPSGPEGETMPESDDGSSGSGDDGEDDDDKGCRVGNRGAVSPWLALLLVTAWRRRAITSAAG